MFRDKGCRNRVSDFGIRLRHGVSELGFGIKFRKWASELVSELGFGIGFGIRLRK